MSNVSSKPAALLDPEPRNAHGVTWGPAAAVLVSALAMAGAYLTAGLVAYMLPHLLGWQPERAAKWFDSVSGQFAFLMLAEAAIVVIIWRFLRYRKAQITTLGFKRRPQLMDAVWVLITFGAYFIAVMVLTAFAKALFHIDLDQKQELGFDTVVSNGERLLTFISLVVVPPLVEEFMFRGFLFTGLRSKLPFAWAAVITSILFASLHLAEGAGGVLWVAGIDTFVLSLFLCFLRERTGNLWAGIALHAVKNSVAFLYLYVFVPH